MSSRGSILYGETGVQLILITTVYYFFSIVITLQKMWRLLCEDILWDELTKGQNNTRPNMSFSYGVKRGYAHLRGVTLMCPPMFWKGSNPKESFIRKVSTYVRQVLARVKTFFGVGSKGSNPEESFIREVSTYVRQVLARVKTFFGVGSLLETPVKQPP